MDNFQEQMEEIEQLKAKQALHRKQLEENRQRALAKRNQTKHLVTLGKIVDKLLPEYALHPIIILMKNLNRKRLHH